MRLPFLTDSLYEAGVSSDSSAKGTHCAMLSIAVHMSIRMSSLKANVKNICQYVGKKATLFHYIFVLKNII